MECHINLRLGCQGIPSFDILRVLNIYMCVDTPEGVLLKTYIYLCALSVQLLCMHIQTDTCMIFVIYTSISCCKLHPHQGSNYQHKNEWIT